MARLSSYALRSCLPVAGEVGEASLRPERLCSSGRPRLRRGNDEELVDPPTAFGQVAPDLPEAPQRPGDAKPRLRLSAVDRPSEGGSDVVVLLLEALEPRARARSGAPVPPPRPSPRRTTRAGVVPRLPPGIRRAAPCRTPGSSRATGTGPGHPWSPPASPSCCRRAPPARRGGSGSVPGNRPPPPPPARSRRRRPRSARTRGAARRRADRGSTRWRHEGSVVAREGPASHSRAMRVVARAGRGVPAG